MLDSLNNGIGEGDTETDGEPAPRPEPSTMNGHAANENVATQTHMVHASNSGRQRTTALDRVRQESDDLAALLELNSQFIPVFVYRLSCGEAGRKALEYQGANIPALRAACADRIQSAIVEGATAQAPIGGSVDDLIARAVEIAQGHPDPGARMANVGDAVTALYEKATSDPALRGLLDGRKLLSVAEQVAAETQRIGAILGSAVHKRIGEAEKTIIAEVLRPRPGGLTPAKLAAGIAVLCAAAGLAVYWAGGLHGLQHTISMLGLPT